MSSAPASDNPSDNRKAPRRRVLKSAVIAFNNRHSTLPCVVRDLSEHGARLIVSGSVNAPDTFELIVDIDGIEVPCAVVSRKGEDVRVKFIGDIVKRAAQRAQVIQAITPKSISIRRKPIATG